MSKYFINIAIGLGIVVPPILVLIFFAAYPVIGYLFLLPLFVWALYYIGMVAREIWEDRRANRLTRM